MNRKPLHFSHNSKAREEESRSQDSVKIVSLDDENIIRTFIRSKIRFPNRDKAKTILILFQGHK